ncbi:alpha/beta hydrolase [candidate division KSB1 bacterium]|nr:alpha/beta hydrolase [candidate division KSB1 bacterium]
MKKALITIGVILLLIIIVSVGYFWVSIGKPLYKPGMVRDGENLTAPLTPPEQSGDSSFWDVETGIKLHHFNDGVGTRVLVIHGGPGYPFESPLPGLHLLSSKYEFIYYDQRGCGKSVKLFDKFESPNYYANMTQLESTLGIGAQVADIERIRQILGEEKLIILGHSFGGFLAALYAAEFPERIQAMILNAPASVLVFPDEENSLFSLVKSKLPQDMHKEYGAFMQRYFDFGSIFQKSEAELAALNREFGKFYLMASNADSAMIQAATDSAENGGWMVQAMYFSMGKKHDYRDALKNVSAPVLVIHGSNDLQPETASRTYSAILPNATLQVLDNAGHFGFNDQPEAFADLVDKFLSELK